MRISLLSISLLVFSAWSTSALAQSTQSSLTDAQRTQLFHPGGINIDVTKAPLADVVKLLNEQLNDTKGPSVSLDHFQVQGVKTGSFTLHLKNASFVDVLRAMNEQYPLNFPLSSNPYTKPVEIADPPESRPAWNYSADGSFAFLTRITLDDNAGQPAKYRIRCRIFFDPRVHLASYQTNSHWISMQDDQRHYLVGENPQSPSRTSPTWSIRFPATEIGELMLIPANPGTRIVAGKALLHWAVAEEFKQEEIADLRTINGTQDVQLGDKLLRVEIDHNPGPAGLSGLSTYLWTADMSTAASMPGLIFMLYDGDTIHRTQPMGVQQHFAIKFPDEPLKLKIYYPTKVTPVEVPIEISDVPLP